MQGLKQLLQASFKRTLGTRCETTWTGEINKDAAIGPSSGQTFVGEIVLKAQGFIPRDLIRHSR